jgi:hypothetical protein
MIASLLSFEVIVIPLTSAIFSLGVNKVGIVILFALYLPNEIT